MEKDLRQLHQVKLTTDQLQLYKASNDLDIKAPNSLNIKLRGTIPANTSFDLEAFLRRLVRKIAACTPGEEGRSVEIERQIQFRNKSSRDKLGVKAAEEAVDTPTKKQKVEVKGSLGIKELARAQKALEGLLVWPRGYVRLWGFRGF